VRKVLLINDTRMVGHHGSSAVVDVIIQQFARRDIIVYSHLQNLGDHGCHAVVINGEGAMHGAQKNSHVFSRIGQEMSQRGIPVFLINTVFDEHTPEIVARMRHFTHVYCRETPSAERLAASGARVGVCPDLTYALELGTVGWRPGDAIVVLDTTVATTNRKLHQFCRENDLRFQPIRTSPRLVRATDPRNLIRIARFNAKKYVGKLAPGSYALNRYSNAVGSTQTFVRLLAEGTRVVIAARFHGVCFCMKVGVPFLAVSSNTPKIEGMLADAGLGDRMLDMADLDLKVIESRSLWTTTHEERRQHYVADAKERISKMFDDIAQTIR
jgi:polysaccharide pyruvyl transferase WcaK-like protein